MGWCPTKTVTHTLMTNNLFEIQKYYFVHSYHMSCFDNSNILFESEYGYKFTSGIFLNPHYAKKHKGGEDAACINDNLICVADGVGGWAESGVDPDIYSKKLCNM